MSELKYIPFEEEAEEFDKKFHYKTMLFKDAQNP